MFLFKIRPTLHINVQKINKWLVEGTR